MIGGSKGAMPIQNPENSLMKIDVLLLTQDDLKENESASNGKKNLQWVLYVILAGLILFLLAIAWILETILTKAKKKEVAKNAIEEKKKADQLSEPMLNDTEIISEFMTKKSEEEEKEVLK